MTYPAVCCPCCLSIELEAREAIISPFISHYVLGSRPARSSLLNCVTCDAMFFSDRYTPEEVETLYRDYRGRRYFSVRHRFEPWYTRRYNERFGEAGEIEARQRVYRAAVASVQTDSIDTVLDYGGDSGLLMVDGPGSRRHVFDISGVEPVDTIISITNAAALAGRVFDLVLLCHVAEHFSEPLAEVGEVVDLVRPGGLIFVEVPFERFPIRDIPTGRWYQVYLDVLRRSPPMLMLMDFWSTGWRVKFGRIPPLGFVKLHEHLNFFNVKSLWALLSGAGLEVLTCEVAPATRAVVAVCRRPAS